MPVLVIVSPAYPGPELFAMLGALVFFIAGISCGGFAIKVYLAQRKLDKMSNDMNGYRENVSVRDDEEDIFDF